MSTIDVSSEELEAIINYLNQFGVEQSELMQDFMNFFSGCSWDDPQAKKLEEEIRVLMEKVGKSVDGEDKMKFIDKLYDKMKVLKQIEGLQK